MDTLCEYSNKYSYILEQCKELSSCHITELDIIEPEFSNTLNYTFDSVLFDINNLLPTLLPLCDMYVLIKLQCRAAYYALCRIREAYTNYLRMLKMSNISKESLNKAFTNEALKLNPKMYENDRVLSDASHVLHRFNLQLYYMSMVEQHVSMLPNATSELFYLHDITTDNSKPYKCIDNYIDYIGVLYSYPVVPPGVSGVVLPSLNGIDVTSMTMQEAGPNSWSRMKSKDAIKVCLFCKNRNLLFGHTDHEEQSNRTICQCVAHNSHHSKSYHMRASSLSRSIVPRQSHEGVLKTKTKMYHTSILEFIAIQKQSNTPK